MGYYGGGGGSGGAATNNQWMMTMERPGPSSYPTGGFVIDLSATFSTLNWCELAVKTVGANLPVAQYQISYDTPSAGKATVKVMRHRYDRVSAIGSINAASQPTGVTIQTASGQTSSSEAAHTHSADHDHGSFTSAAPASPSGNMLLDALGPSGTTTHTHTLDLPNISVTSGAGTSHNHTDNSLYAHGHNPNQTATDIASVELANAVDLSGTTWFLFASGVKA